MKILLLNQFVPPAQPPTARLVGDLADSLRQAGHEVLCLGRGSDYGAARGLRRMLRDVSAHLRISWQVLLSGRCDWIVCLSDPTGLPFTAWLLSIIKRARLAHWAMDIYPDIAVALGVMREGVVTRVIRSLMRLGYRGCDLLVALDADMAALIEKISGKKVLVMPPWPPEVAESATKTAAADGKLTWLYSGNLGRAHEYETLLRTQKVLEQRGSFWELHFQGGGPSIPAAKALAKALGLQRCFWSGYVDDRELLTSLLKAKALIATQLPVTRGMLWPSKLAMMKHLRVPLVWVGPEKGAVAAMLDDLPSQAVAVAPNEVERLADWLLSLPSVHEAAKPQEVAEKIRVERAAGLCWWRTLLEAR